MNSFLKKEIGITHKISGQIPIGEGYEIRKDGLKRDSKIVSWSAGLCSELHRNIWTGIRNLEPDGGSLFQNEAIGTVLKLNNRRDGWLFFPLVANPIPSSRYSPNFVGYYISRRRRENSCKFVPASTFRVLEIPRSPQGIVLLPILCSLSVFHFQPKGRQEFLYVFFTS